MYTVHSGYQQNLYHDKPEVVDGLSYQYDFPLIQNIDHPELIQEWKQSLDSDAYEKI